MKINTCKPKNLIIDLSTRTIHLVDMSSWNFIWFWGATWKVVCCDQYSAMGSESLIAFGSLSSSNIQIDTKWSNQNQQLSYCWYIIILCLLLLAPSGALIAIPTYYWPTTSSTHFFRPHRSSTLDFHFLSHYSYIKAIMLYKGNHWTQWAGFMDAS